MREYVKTHPWLTFSADLSKAPMDLWMMLGECKSKCEHISGQPLRPDIAKRLHELYLAKGVLATVAIEGNTLSEDEANEYLKGDLRLPLSQEYLGQELDNIANECNEICSIVTSGAVPPISQARILELNTKVLANLNLNEGVVRGEIRKGAFGVGPYRGAPAGDCEYLLDRLCQWLNSSDFISRDKSNPLVYAILKAILAHLYIAWIHPFGDGNGRTARLLEFQILLSAGVPAPASHLLSNHYNLTRADYYRQLDRASKSGGDVVPFILYAVQGLLDGLRGQLQKIKSQVLDEVWQSYAHDQFLDRTSPSDVRRKDLIEDLSKMSTPVPVSQLAGITPRVARHYARKTTKTVTRDVNELKKMGLVTVQEDGSVRPRKERVLAFLPDRAVPHEAHSVTSARRKRLRRSPRQSAETVTLPETTLPF